MARRKAEPFGEDTHEATGEEKCREYQSLIDQANWRGTGQPPCPDKLVIHEYESSSSEGEQHIYRPKRDVEPDPLDYRSKGKK